MNRWLHPIRTRRRRKATSVSFPPEWDGILARNFPLDARLPAEDRRKLRRLVQIFLVEKHFEGVGGLELTDEIRVTIAAQACLLLLHRSEAFMYPRLSSILVYPTAYVAPVTSHDAGGVVTEGEDVRLGEAWKLGVVVLSWEDVRFGAADQRDGTNLVLHEFAHQLDLESNVADGAPPLPRRSMYVPWARVLGESYRDLRRRVARDQRTVMDAYGATNPAEFFAVATETFFERPGRLRSRYPEMYELLREFYRQDPAAYHSASGS